MGLAQHQGVRFFPKASQPFSTFWGEIVGSMTLQKHIIKRNFITIHSALGNLPERLIRQALHSLKFCLKSRREVFFYRWRQAASERLNDDLIHRAGCSLGLCLQLVIKMFRQFEGNSTNRHNIPFDEQSETHKFQSNSASATSADCSARSSWIIIHFPRADNRHGFRRVAVLRRVISCHKFSLLAFFALLASLR